MARLQDLGDVMTQYGTHMALSMAVLITGLLLVRWIEKGMREGLHASCRHHPLSFHSAVPYTSFW
jgi:hypothetical protein